MTCRLCGQLSTGPDGLCSDCTRALTRARDGSAAVRKGPPIAPAGRRRLNRINLTLPVSSGLAATSAPGRVWGRLLVWGALAVVVVAIVALGSGGVTSNRAHGASAVDRAPRITAVLPYGAQGDPDAADAETGFVAAHPNDPDPFKTPAPRTRPAPARASAPRSPPSAPAGTAGGASTRPAAVDARVRNSAGLAASDSDRPAQLAQASVPPTAMTRDDGQALASALEKCVGETFLAGVICEQKARLRYCEGKWGQVPQCTPRPKAD
jgi:hypothetical protein